MTRIADETGPTTSVRTFVAAHPDLQKKTGAGRADMRRRNQ
jgi:hypothetical protein